MKKLMLLSCLLTILVTACMQIPQTDDEGNTEDPIPSSGIELGKGFSDEVVLDPKGNFVNLRFSSAKDWHLEISDDAEWLEVSPLEGDAGSARIKIKAEINDTGKKRFAEVDICSEEETLTLTVTQDKFVPKFELVESETEVSFLGGYLSVRLNSDMEFEHTCVSDWLTYVQTDNSSADDEFEVLFEVSPNNTSADRSATITFSAAAERLEFTVVQGTDGLGSKDWKTAKFAHRSLAMRFTATWCGYCPAMASAFEEVKEQIPDDIELVSLHAASSDLAFASISSLVKRFDVKDYPTGVVDARAAIPNYTNTSTIARAAKAVAMETQQEYPATTGVACSSAINGSELYLTLGLYAKSAGNYRLTALVLEDNIVSYQNNGGNNYVHNDVARRAVTSINGESVAVQSDGQLVIKSYTATLQSDWNKENLKLLIYVEKPYDGTERKNEVSEAKYSDFGTTYVDNCRVIQIGDVATLDLE